MDEDDSEEEQIEEVQSSQHASQEEEKQSPKQEWPEDNIMNALVNEPQMEDDAEDFDYEKEKMEADSKSLEQGKLGSHCSLP